MKTNKVVSPEHRGTETAVSIESGISLKVIKAKNVKRAHVSLSFDFNADDPQAEHIYRGIGLLLREALTEEEARIFLRKFEAERGKFATPAEAKRAQAEPVRGVNSRTKPSDSERG